MCNVDSHWKLLYLYKNQGEFDKSILRKGSYIKCVLSGLQSPVACE